VARARATQSERLITAEWGSAREEVFPVDIVVEAGDRPGLLRDLSEVFSKERINVTAVNTLSRRDLARMSFTLEVKSVAELRRALAQVRDVAGVLSAMRR
jgi:GTP pyrophosphokinase